MSSDDMSDGEILSRIKNVQQTVTDTNRRVKELEEGQNQIDTKQQDIEKRVLANEIHRRGLWSALSIVAIGIGYIIEPVRKMIMKVLS